MQAIGRCRGGLQRLRLSRGQLYPLFEFSTGRTDSSEGPQTSVGARRKYKACGWAPGVSVRYGDVRTLAGGDRTAWLSMCTKTEDSTTPCKTTLRFDRVSATRQ